MLSADIEEFTLQIAVLIQTIDNISHSICRSRMVEFQKIKHNVARKKTNKNLNEINETCLQYLLIGWTMYISCGLTAVAAVLPAPSLRGQNLVH